MELDRRAGATPHESPKKTTDFLVIGDGFTGTSAEEFHTGRAAKAVKVNAKGGHIEVLTEGEFLEMLTETHTSGMRLPTQRAEGLTAASHSSTVGPPNR